MLRYVDRQFKGYGVKFYGEEIMNRFSDREIEEMRCSAFTVASETFAEFEEYLMTDDYKHAIEASREFLGNMLEDLVEKPAPEKASAQEICFLIQVAYYLC